jgi:The GLUG motif
LLGGAKDNEEKKMKTGTTFILSLTAILILVAGSAFGAYSGGNGTAGAPYQIATKADLLALAANTGDYSKCFILTADINMGGQVFTTAIIASGPPFIFNGTFDGNGHKITNFTINGGSNSYLGLFGNTTSNGSVKNLGIENCSVSGNYSIGGLVGMNYGNISNCYSTGSVSGFPSSSAGGLVGMNYGIISNCYSTGSVSGFPSFNVGGLVGWNVRGSISNCYSMSSVSGSAGSNAVGGLVGWNHNGSISNCYSTGTVTCDSNSQFVGGLAGENDGNISDCYSMGSVSGGSNVGGLAGWNYTGSISDCYSMGSVSGSTGSYYVGGLLGLNGNGTVTSCYSTGFVSGVPSSHYVGGLVGGNGGGYLCISGCFWDINTAGQTIGVGFSNSPLGVLGRTTAQMKTLSTFASTGWDFTTIWRMRCEGMNYPKLNWQVVPTADWVCPDGVNFADFSYFASRWHTTGCDSSNNFCGGADMDSSGTVDIQDLAIFAGEWLTGE